MMFFPLRLMGTLSLPKSLPRLSRLKLRRNGPTPSETKGTLLNNFSKIFNN